MSQDTIDAQTFSLTVKERSIAKRALRELFSKSSLEPVTIEVIRQEGFFGYISRCIDWNSGGKALLSEKAHAALHRLLDLFDSASNDLRFSRSDVNNALRKVCVTCFQRNEAPESAEELVELLLEAIRPEIASRTFVATIYGIQLEPGRQLKLGALTVHREARKVVDEACIESNGMLNWPTTKKFASSTCIHGALVGTICAATERFKEQATLAAGMLAVDIGVNYQRAATSFSIEVRIGRPASISQGTFAHWIAGKPDSFTISLGGGSTQVLKFSDERIAELSDSPVFQHAFDVFQKPERNSLEEAFVRAVYWYGDAHTDETRVMQFVKYWSCLECLLGSSSTEVTESLASNTVTLLTLGPLQLFDVEQASMKLKDIKRLYKARSKAVHRAAHSHITFEDIVTMSTLAAYAIFNVLIFLKSGRESLQELWEKLDQAKIRSGIVTNHPQDFANATQAVK